MTLGKSETTEGISNATIVIDREEHHWAPLVTSVICVGKSFQLVKAYGMSGFISLVKDQRRSAQNGF